MRAFCLRINLATLVLCAVPIRVCTEWRLVVIRICDAVAVVTKSVCDAWQTVSETICARLLCSWVRVPETGRSAAEGEG